MMNEIKVNDIVKTSYNSGEYVGRVLEDKGNFFLIEVLAVLVHPTQGDLHQRGQVEGVAFHERKALAYTEKTNARKRMTEHYNEPIPDYTQSLKNAVHFMKQELKTNPSTFNKLSLEKLHDLEIHFYNKIFAEAKERND